MLVQFRRGTVQLYITAIDETQTKRCFNKRCCISLLLGHFVGFDVVTVKFYNQ